MAAPTPASSSAPPEPPAGAPPGRRGWRVAAWALGAAIGIAAISACGWAYAVHVLNNPGPLPEARDVVIPRGGESAVASALADSEVVARPLPFRIAAFLTRREGPLHAGEFAFPAHASLRVVLDVIRSGRPVQHHLTIPEGLTAWQIAALLGKGDALTGPSPIPPEGQALPETYAFVRGTAREAILARAAAAMDRALHDAWEARAPDLPLASPEQALILASIVERETAKPEERPHVAAVFLNRLRLGMKLQSDPTVIYAASDHTGMLDHPLTRADLDRDDPYNTYRVAGLPPGPIDSPGFASLRAVTQPARSDDLYFVADGTGGHVFARTLDDHARNVARWRTLGQPGPEVR